MLISQGVPLRRLLVQPASPLPNIEGNFILDLIS